MNSRYNHRSNQHHATHSAPILATEGWHRFVTGLCIFACFGVIAKGVARLFDPTEGRAVPAKPMDSVAGASFILLGTQGCRFLVRQFRAPTPTSTGKPRIQNDRNA
jgi:hypothetical protein